MTVDTLVGRAAGISYLHIPARNPAASAAFYRAVFGWQTHGDADHPGFADGTGHVIGRWVTDQEVVGTDGLRAYIYVASVDQTLSAVNAHGGRTVRAPYAEGTLRVALFSDPAGNVLGLWQETANPPRAAVAGIEPELWVEHPRDAIAFYVAAFGATVLHQVGDGEEIVAQLTAGNANFWIANSDPDAGRFSSNALGGGTSRTLLVVHDPAALVDTACAAGATLTAPVGEEHGWRLGRITDPFGHEWEIGKPIVPWPPE